ncbi:hypothetical protein AB4331_05840 [Vibrio breoganii]
MISHYLPVTAPSTDLELTSFNIHKHLAVAHHKAPKNKDKKAAMLKVGILLAKARAEFASDNDFGKWVGGAITKKCSTEIKKVTRQTLRRYRLLADFSSNLVEFDKKFERCMDVGFSNVYKLMEEKNLELRKQYLDGSINSSEVDRKLHPERYIKQQDLVFTGFKKEVANFTESQAEELILLLAEHHNIDLN